MGVKVTHLCDFDDKKAEAAALLTKPKKDDTYFWHPDWREVIGETDYLSIASYDQFHAEQVIAGLNADQRVFCEKPLCLNQDELDAIAHAASNSTGDVGINLPLRHTGFADDIRTFLSNRDGICFVRAVYHYGRNEKLANGWRSECPDYSILLGGGVHLVDLILWITGLQIIPLSVMGGNFCTPNFDGMDYVEYNFGSNPDEGGLVGTVVCDFTTDHDHYHEFTIISKAGKTIHINRDSSDKGAALKDFLEGGKTHAKPYEIVRLMETCFQMKE